VARAGSRNSRGSRRAAGVPRGRTPLSFFLEPWAAAHLRITPASPELDGRAYSPPWLNGELSLKLGVFFDL